MVEDEECVASGLNEGTDYDFRVRAIPSDTDRYLTSDWSDVEEARTEGTAPPEPTTPTTGGMGDLNMSGRPRTQASSLSGTALRMPNMRRLSWMDYSDDPEPCEGLEFCRTRVVAHPSPLLPTEAWYGVCAWSLTTHRRR